MLTVYGDVNCPYSALASQRVDRLLALGVSVAWRMVEHDRTSPVTGRPAGPGLAAELADVAALTLPGEIAPTSPASLPHTAAAVSAYAEALTDGVADELRRRLFDAVWVDHMNISDAVDVRRLVAEVMPRDPRPAWQRLPYTTVVPDHPDPAQAARLLSGTVTRLGDPLTGAGHRRVNSWRAAWLAASGGTVPTVVDEWGRVHAGVAGLRLLGEGIAALAPASLSPASPSPASGGAVPAPREAQGELVPVG